MKRHHHEKWKREEIVNLCQGTDLIGVELGVARGSFSKKMLDSNKFKKFYGVDMYSDMHDTEEYKIALKHVGIDSPYSLFRMRFDEAVDLFEDNSLDFIYIDGYAHTGQLGGETLQQWYPKLKVGGVFAGDDYDEKKWPMVVEVVDTLAQQIADEIHFSGIEANDEYSESRSWAIVKTKPIELEVEQEMLIRGKQQEWLVSLYRPYVVVIKQMIKKIIS